MAGAEGTTFGRYFLLKKLAAGGMGEIFLAKIKGPVGFEKILVVKRVLEQFVENEDFLDMFFAEARVAAQLTHSNIVQIYEMGQIEDAYFIAMEYCHGKGLREVIDRARDLGEFVPPVHAIEIISKLCAGLSYAHNASDMAGNDLGIIHRDINPHNALVSYGGDVKVIDFGIAKSEMQSNETQAGTIKGKFVYMSPEQSAAEVLDKRSDIFAVGICLHEVLTGVNPFAKANVILSLDAIQRENPDPPSQTNVRLAPFDRISRKALAKKRDERYQDCLELRDDLQALLATGDIAKHPQSLAEYMHDLFADQIIKEKRMIVETDTASTSDLEQMRAAAVADNVARPTEVWDEGSSGGAKVGSLADELEGDEDDLVEEFGGATEEFDAVAAHAAASVEVVEEPKRSRWPFVALLVGVLAATGVASVLLIGGDDATGEVAMTSVQEVPQPGAEPTARPSAAPVRPRAENPGTSAAPAKTPKAHGVRKPPKAKKKPPKKPEPPPPPAAPAGHGNITVSSSPPLKVTHKGRTGQTIKLDGDSGTIILGSSSDGKKLFIKLSYVVKGTKISVTDVSALPWAIVSKDGLTLGKTPLKKTIATGKKVSLEFVNPTVKKQRVSLRFSR